MPAPVLCHNPAREKHEIAPGEPKITIAGVTVEWGDRDVRGPWTGGYVFCSFACLSEWAAARADDHDGRVVEDGPTPEGDGTHNAVESAGSDA